MNTFKALRGGLPAAQQPRGRWRLLTASIVALVLMMLWVGETPASAAITVDQSTTSPSTSLVIGTSQPNELILIAADGWPGSATPPTVTVDGSPAGLVAFEASDVFHLNSGGASVFQFVAPGAGLHTIAVGEGGYSAPPYSLNFAASLLGATNAGLTSMAAVFPQSLTLTASIATSTPDQYVFATSTHNTGRFAPGAVTWTGAPETPTVLQTLHVGNGIDSSIAGFNASIPGTYSATSSD